MSATLAEARRYTDLLRAPGGNGSPYAFDRIFRRDGIRARWLSRRKLKFLKAIDAAVRALLEEGEIAHCVTWGVRSSFVEQYFLGWALYFLNRTALVLTTRRILLIQVGVRNRPLALRSQIRYEGIASVSRGLLGHLKLKFRGGGHVTFYGVPRADRKYVRDLVRKLAQRAESANLAATDGRLVHLCPHCYAEVKGYPDRCANCGGGFKSANRAGWLSLIFPGFGDFYIGHRKLALLEMFGTALLWLALLLPNPEVPMTALELAITAVLMIVFVHGIDAIVTRTLARKGIYPAAE